MLIADAVRAPTRLAGQGCSNPPRYAKMASRVPVWAFDGVRLRIVPERAESTRARILRTCISRVDPMPSELRYTCEARLKVRPAGSFGFNLSDEADGHTLFENAARSWAEPLSQHAMSPSGGATDAK